jgi:hypothetical protein
MLENYYDIARKDSFEAMFGHLAISRNPTPQRNERIINASLFIRKRKLGLSQATVVGTIRHLFSIPLIEFPTVLNW